MSLNRKQLLYEAALELALARIKTTDKDNINPQLLTACVNLLKIDEKKLKVNDNAEIMRSFISSTITASNSKMNETELKSI